jgi:hypothetical protein
MPRLANALLDQIADPIASFTADGPYDHDQSARRVVSVIQTLPS